MKSTGWHSCSHLGTWFEGTQFVYQLGYCVCLGLKFIVIFLSPSRQMAEEVRTVEGSHILLRPVKLSVHSSATSGLCVARGTDSKCKRKVVHFRAKKAYSGNINITPFIVNIATGWRRLVHFTPRLLNFLEEPRFPLTRNWVSLTAGRDDFQKIKISCPCRDSNPGSSSP